MNIGTVLRAGAFLLACGAATANANLLTNGDFETNTFGTLIAPVGVWGGEANSQLTGATNGVTPFGSQMLEIGDAIGGSAAQVAQAVSGSFTAGSTVTFQMEVNSNNPYAGPYSNDVLLNLSFDGWGAGAVDTSLTLDNDASTWQTLTLTHVLTADVSTIYAQVLVWMTSGPGGSRYIDIPGNFVYADNAVLTVTPVPTPLSLLLLAAGLLGLRLRRA